MEKQQIAKLIEFLSEFIALPLLYAIIYYFYNRFIGFKNIAWKFILYIISMIIINFSLILVPNMLLKFIISLLIELVLIHFLCNGSILVKAYALTVKETMLLLISIFFLPFDFWILPLTHNTNMNFSEHMIMNFINIFIGNTVMFLILFIFLKLLSNILSLKSKSLTFHQSLYLLIPCLSSYVFAFIFYSIQIVKIDNKEYNLPYIFYKLYWILPIVSFFLLVSLLTTAYIFNKMLEGQYFAQKNLLMKQQIELQMDHVKNIEGFYNGVKGSMHDINNHLNCLRALADSNNIDILKKYIENINETLIKLDFEIKTGNAVSDVIINEKYNMAKSKDIEFICDFLLPKDSALQPDDICVILSNALDNAIEACMKITNGNVFKKISIKSYIRNLYLIIEISNSTISNLKYDGDKIITTKTDILNHGIGISNIKAAANKYNGIVDIMEEKNKFTINIMLKIK